VNFYTSFLRPILFRMDAERAHVFALRVLALTPPALLRVAYGPPVGAPREVFGMRFPNPVGLAAGMDKDAVALPAWEALGFGFAEIGTVTALAQPGNPKPRVFRHPAHRALINRMGFNNPGAEAVAARLARLRASGKWPRIPVGINIGKSKVTPLDEAPADYGSSARTLAPHADYFAINVSSPNTPGLRGLQETRRLEEVVGAVRQAAPAKPVLVKIAPDLSDEEAAAIADMAQTCGLDGLIATNTTLNHAPIPASADQEGGLSGVPLAARATEVVRLLAGRTSLPVVASGGVMDIQDALEKFRAGARLVQLYTGFVYGGPSLVGGVARALRGVDPGGPQSP
jgi:dihydroorotate dehydrogenase